MQEEWKPIGGYENLYEVSSFGRIKSLDRLYSRGTKILKNKITKDGYYETTLLKNGKSKCIRTHRLVAQNFIENIENKPQVNHIDGNKLNNHVCNLEWVNGSENQKHAYKTGLQKVSGGAILNRKKVKCIELHITKNSLGEMQRFLYKNGYTKSKKLNRLSTVINSGKNKYLGMTFELVKEV